MRTDKEEPEVMDLEADIPRAGYFSWAGLFLWRIFVLRGLLFTILGIK